MERAAARLRLWDMRALCVAMVAAVQLGQGFSAFPIIPPYLPVLSGSAVIMLTGSTNTTGYRIVVGPDGTAQYVTAAGRGRGTVDSSVAQRFFMDLQATAPLAGLPEGSCMKSASFGTSFFVYWNHSRSPDLTCTSGAGKTIAGDAEAVTSALGVQMRMRVMVRPALPGEQHRPVPAPTST
jgi:hypothetical protein